jgi:hypothetical protein
MPKQPINTRIACALIAIATMMTATARQAIAADVDIRALINQSWLPKAPALAKPTGQIIKVANVDQLFEAAKQIKPGGTILLADGKYMMPRFFAITTDRVTMRSASGDRTKVIIDGLQSQHGELVGIRGRGITVADLTIQNIKWNGFKVMEFGTHEATIRNCIIHNIWQRGVKASAVPKDKQELSPKNCRIQYCLFYNDRAKKKADDAADPFDGNYIGGIDANNTIDWVISDNVFVGIQGRTREGRAAIYISENGKGCLIERNIFIDCDVAIGLGNPTLGYSPLQCIDCVARNNFITRCPETGILADYTKNCRIEHNTIHDPTSRLKRLILIQDSNQGLQVTNNLLSGPPIRIRSQNQSMRLENNAVFKNLSDSFVDAEKGNLHLKRKVTNVVDAGKKISVKRDIDNRNRDAKPDIGADEYIQPKQ